ncbi:MAG TPA: DnaD domain protein [Anaerolineales bacterium]|nr:DnaD domain protein [Anaerolineales bacterium]
MSKNPLLQTLISMTGQDNVITVHRPFVEFTGSLEAAMMLSQLLYWTSRSTMGGWIAKSDKDWKKELCLTRYGHRKATETLVLMGVAETQIKKFNGAPTTHYLILWETLENEWISWLRSSENERTESAKTDDGTSESELSLTETTAETTSKIEEEDVTQDIFKVYQREIGVLTKVSADFLEDAEKTYGPKWVCDAITEAVKNNVRNWKYIEAILKRWKAQGNQEAMNKNGKWKSSKPDLTEIMREYAEEHGYGNAF